MNYKACIFDLDGTLVNSIYSLVYCTNQALAKFGLGPLNEEQMMKIVGDGYQMQMRRSLIAAGDKELTHYEEILPAYMEIFSKDCLYRLDAYEGIRELLEFVKGQGMKIAVVSNKPDAQALRVVDHVFGENYFDAVLGASDGLPRKPDPAGALSVADKLGAKPSECLYFGDTNTDMQTGKNAGMITIGVLWGFRDREELGKYAPDHLIETPMDMKEILMGRG